MKNEALNEATILDVLRSVYDGEKDVVSRNMVSSIVIRGERVGFALEVSPDEAGAKEPLRVQCEEAVSALPGVEQVTVVLTAEQKESAKKPSRPQAAAPTSKAVVQGAKHIIAVVSGKGGVGKSTTTMCLARAFATQGYKVGIVDADIYGPSIPHMTNQKEKPKVENNKMIPLMAEGIQVISIGHLIDPEKAILWRAPMVTKALHQLLCGTAWADVDILLVDTPPGTGDLHISLMKQYPIDGVVLVSTPQEVALLDVRKAFSMLGTLSVPILGVIENMSYFEDGTGGKHFPFGQGGGEQFSEEMQVPFLGSVPMEPKICQAVDKGALFSEKNEKDSISNIFNDIAIKTYANLKEIQE